MKRTIAMICSGGQASRRGLGSIDSIVSHARRTFARPKAFFVAWSGVLTLAYEGFTPPLAEIKQEIDKQNIDSVRVFAEEKSGAKWPKTTLGAVQDGKRIDRAQLEVLRDLCDAFDRRIKNESWQLEVDRLQVVLFACRSLEKRLIVHEIPLAQPAGRAQPRKAQLKEVEDTLRPFAREDLGMYWVDVAKDGNRCSHYRDPHIEATLVCFLPEVPSYVGEFKKAVDKAVGKGFYCWFDNKSLHMTVRGLS